MNVQWLTPSSGTFQANDVTFLLENSSAPLMGLEDKEEAIQSGRMHYSECITEEAPPTDAYLTFFSEAMARSGMRFATHLRSLSEGLAQELTLNAPVVLVSLARAGTPVGVLLKRQLARDGFDVAHYSISIVRDKGLDILALAEIANRHADLSQLIFVDGWTGKGTITKELTASVHSWNVAHPTQVIPFRLAVVADPCGWATHSATREDYLIPNAVLNATVSGCVSRTTSLDSTRPHGARFFTQLVPFDKSQLFVDVIDKLVKSAFYDTIHATQDVALQKTSREWFERAKKYFNAKTDNHLKPGIPETTRVLLRRKPRLIAVRNMASEEVQHLLFLAKEKDIQVEVCADMPYEALGVIDGINGD